VLKNRKNIKEYKTQYTTLSFMLHWIASKVHLLWTIEDVNKTRKNSDTWKINLPATNNIIARK